MNSELRAILGSAQPAGPIFGDLVEALTRTIADPVGGTLGALERYVEALVVNADPGPAPTLTFAADLRFGAYAGKAFDLSLTARRVVGDEAAEHRMLVFVGLVEALAVSGPRRRVYIEYAHRWWTRSVWASPGGLSARSRSCRTRHA